MGTLLMRLAESYAHQQATCCDEAPTHRLSVWLHDGTCVAVGILCAAHASSVEDARRR